MDIQAFDFSVNLLRASLWQYNDATNLQGLLNAKNTWYLENQTQFWNNWYNDVFNLQTANDFGIKVWGEILGLKLYVNPTTATGDVFGFDGSDGFNFDNGILTDYSSYELPLEIKRIALQLRYFQLVSSGTVPETNRMLKYVFRNYGNAFLYDYGAMKQLYIFNFPVIFDLQYLFNNYDILPRPAGVKSNWYDNTIGYFGFGSTNVNFNNGILGANYAFPA